MKNVTLFPTKKTNKIVVFPNTPEMKLDNLNKQIKELQKQRYERWMIRQNKSKPNLRIVK